MDRTRTEEPGTVLLLGAYRQSLAVAWELETAGHRSVLGVSRPDAALECSRAIHSVWRHPPVEYEHEFLRALGRLLEDTPEVTHVVPVGALEVWALDALRDRLPGGVSYLMPNRFAIRTCAAKPDVTALAVGLEVPVAPYRRVGDAARAMAAVAELGLPCVLKPVSEHRRIHGAKALIVDSGQTLRRLLAGALTEPVDLLVQRQVPGQRHCLYFFAAAGRLLAARQFLVARTDHPDGTGYAVSGTSVPLCSRWLAHTERLLARLRYHGYGSLQYIRDPRSGEETFLEINARLGGAHAALARVNMQPVNWAITLERQGTVAVPDPFRYPVGERYRWFTGDLSGLLDAVRFGHLGSAAALRWLRALPATLLGGGHLVWRWRDPMPALRLLARVARRHTAGWSTGPRAAALPESGTTVPGWRGPAARHPPECGRAGSGTGSRPSRTGP